MKDKAGWGTRQTAKGLGCHAKQVIVILVGNGE